MVAKDLHAKSCKEVVLANEKSAEIDGKEIVKVISVPNTVNII